MRFCDQAEKPWCRPGRLAVAAVLLLVPCVGRSAETVYFRNVSVFDGLKRIPRVDVVIADGRIVQIGSDLTVPAGAAVIAGDGKTLLPGLIDSHVHATSVADLKQSVVFGVTTGIDMFTSHQFAATMRAEQQTGKAPDRADLVSAGTLVTAAGGHGTEYSLRIPTIARPGDAVQFVADRLAEGSDFIKIVYDDGKEIGLAWPTIDRATLRAVIAEAHAHKKLAVVHVLAREFARQALEERADGLVHLFVDQPVDAGLLELAVTSKAFVIPTLTVLKNIAGDGNGASLAADPELAPYLNPVDRHALRSRFPISEQALSRLPRRIPDDATRKLFEAGVPVLAGTDATNPGTAHGASLHGELELLVAAGLTPIQALAAATSTPARIFGLGDRGRIAPGMRADLVLVVGDPCTDIKATRAIAGVWKGGQTVDREARRGAVRRATEGLAALRKAAPPKGSESGLVSDFEDGTASARFGGGWSISTDAMMGGKSKARFKLVPEGAQGGKGSLQISGTVAGDPPMRWAGVLFSPGPRSMAPANLSARKAIRFWAKGDGKAATVMLFFQANGFEPSMKPFVPGKNWKEYRFDLDEFSGCDGSGLLGLFFGGSAEAGPFTFQIDEVRFE